MSKKTGYYYSLFFFREQVKNGMNRAQSQPAQSPKSRPNGE